MGSEQREDLPLLPTLRQLEQQPQGPAARGACCAGTRLLLTRREPVTRQLRDRPPGAAGRGPCWQGRRVRAGRAVLWSWAGAWVTVISEQPGLEASEAAVLGGLFSTSGRRPGLCMFMCSFLMWWTTAAALKAC